MISRPWRLFGCTHRECLGAHTNTESHQTGTGRPRAFYMFRGLLLYCYYRAVTAAVERKSGCSVMSDCDHTDDSPPGSSVPGILQSRLLEWLAMTFSRGSS